MKTELDYNDGKNIHDGFRIGASGISSFIYSTTAFFREKLLGETGFEGNKNSVLGTVVHYCLEKIQKKEVIDTNEIQKYLVSQSTNILTIEDINYILEQYPFMVETTAEQYNLEVPANVEMFVHHEVTPGVHVGGSIDRFEPVSGTITDWKTTSSKSLPDKIPLNYLWQQLTYAYVLRKLGHKVNLIEIVYISTNIPGDISPKTGKQLKSYPPEVKVLTHVIQEADLEFIESIINLTSESVDKFIREPKLRYLIAKDYRLKYHTENLLHILGEIKEEDPNDI